MKYEIFKLNFSTAVHIGKTRLSEAEHIISADTLFSALCHEALKKGALDTFISRVKADKIRLSDAMPFHGDDYYIPKPYIKIDMEESGDFDDRKTAKKLKYVNISSLPDYLHGRLDSKGEFEKFRTIGKSEIRTMAKVMEDDDAEPFSVGTFWFGKDWGLYVIAACEEDTDKKLVEELIHSLGYAGIGGKRTAGLGKFTVKINENCPQAFADKLTVSGNGKKYILLSTALPSADELKSVVDGADYQIQRRGGFVSSENYGDGTFRKKDFYSFQAGSVFDKTFDGVLADVAGEGNHPVYRYAKPIFLEV